MWRHLPSTFGNKFSLLAVTYNPQTQTEYLSSICIFKDAHINDKKFLEP